MTVRDDEAALRVEQERVRRPELARSGARFADGAKKLPAPVEYGNSSDQVRILDVGVALRDVHIAIPVGDHIGRIRQRGWWIAGYTRRAQCHQHLSFRAELDDDTALGCFPR